MGLDFPTNLLISGKSSSKTFLTKTENNDSNSYSKIGFFSFLEIVQVAIVEVPSVLTFKLASILSTTSSILVYSVVVFSGQKNQ